MLPIFAFMPLRSVLFLLADGFRLMPPCHFHITRLSPRFDYADAADVLFFTPPLRHFDAFSRRFAIAAIIDAFHCFCAYFHTRCHAAIFATDTLIRHCFSRHASHADYFIAIFDAFYAILPLMILLRRHYDY